MVRKLELIILLALSLSFVGCEKKFSCSCWYIDTQTFAYETSGRMLDCQQFPEENIECENLYNY